MTMLDFLVLGAGAAGVCSALHLQSRGGRTAIIERLGQSGEATSFGNAGLIERSGLVPYVFPRDAKTILQTMLGKNPKARIDWRSLPSSLPWIYRYYRESAPERVQSYIAAALPLIERCLDEHELIAAEANALPLIRRNGTIKLYRTDAALEKALAERAWLAGHGMEIDVLDADGLARLEAGLTGFIGALHFRQTGTVTDPGGLVKAYAGLFEERGGQILQADARSLAEGDGHWSVTVDGRQVKAKQVVVALGPWAGDVLRGLGYRFPLGSKRGYHMHYEARDVALNRPVVDVEAGYVLAPMRAGIRLTTGVEFAARDAPPDYRQIEAAERKARLVFPLGARTSQTPWMGSRPCMPDLIPVVGPAPRHKGLWFNFGHHHHGLTFGPVCGRLIAELAVGSQPCVDPTPYSPSRFA